MDVSAIPSLTRSELLGWHAVVTHPTEPWGREPLDGEIAALTRRAQVLGMTLSASASRAALCGVYDGGTFQKQGGCIRA